ncbi:uncharacterized protein DUF397 [Streptomyces sp. Ag109_O5-1]|uniref:DUF397 domain-containing protein n=1 Tax=Streptomyces sp. Ag109_O5-1 TaxID=1938851 RepID=UPI000F4FB278|nr:DUF397 domain-containing protein [Streptomyces sp. Ag109_O5-1]RPE40972.1 uncharacterized protein DUF397 [Streptomyces sp. Ag109_O5-1]
MTVDNWRRSSHSGSGDGNNCVEVAHSPTRISVRDSKASTRAILTLHPRAFAAFVNALRDAHS